MIFLSWMYEGGPDTAIRLAALQEEMSGRYGVRRRPFVRSLGASALSPVGSGDAVARRLRRWRVLRRKSSQKAGCMSHPPASHSCHERKLVWINCAALVWVRPAAFLCSCISLDGGETTTRGERATVNLLADDRLVHCHDATSCRWVVEPIGGSPALSWPLAVAKR